MAYSSSPNNKGGYGKRPLWQWIALYLVVGGVIYYGIYYYLAQRNGGYNAGGSSTGIYNTK